MKKIFPIIISLVILAAIPGQALPLQAVEAWLSKSSFDGQMFRYEFIAFDTQEPVTQNASVDCEFSTFKGHPVLAAVQVRILLKSKFDQPGKTVIKNGELDIRAKINECRAQLPKGTGLTIGPVQVKLPPISYSMK